MDFAAKKTSRRQFAKKIGTIIPVLGFGADLLGDPRSTLEPFFGRREKNLIGNELAADLVILGGGLGGCAAAWAAARNGLRVIMTEEGDWIGGQLTQQAVPPDENHWIESFGGTRTYLELREKIRAYYRDHYSLSSKARNNPLLNPGNGWVSRLCHEPKVSLAVLREILRPYEASGQLTTLLRHRPIAAEVDGDRVRAVKVIDGTSGGERVLHAPYFIDATELGELLPLARMEFVSGAESQAETGERHAASVANPDACQGFTMSFAMDYLSGEDHNIGRPADYDYWREQLSPHSRFKLISVDNPEFKKVGFDPGKKQGMWTYRRIIDQANFAPGAFASDISIINWGQNDYSQGGLLDATTAAETIRRAKQQSLSLLYWLQTEAPRPDGGTGWKGLRLRPDIMGTEDGLSKMPYVRESRRIKAEFTVLEKHVSTKARTAETKLKIGEVTAAPFYDSVGIGSYPIDIHATSGGGGGLSLSTLPFQIPLGALIPLRMENVLPGAKNLGVTHLTNGCYRLHPIEWNIGESAALLIAFCKKEMRLPREVYKKEKVLAEFQTFLALEGVRISWPKSATKPT